MNTKTIPNFLRNSEEIVNIIERSHADKFKSREGEYAHEGYLPGIKSQFSTLHHTDMSEELITALFKDSEFDQETADMYSFIQIQRYMPGDYIVWHNDAYNIVKLHLVTLTSSEIDGLCVAEDGKIFKVYDSAGQYIDFPYDAPHAVEVVKNIRYSLVIGM